MLDQDKIVQGNFRWKRPGCRLFEARPLISVESMRPFKHFCGFNVGDNGDNGNKNKDGMATKSGLSALGCAAARWKFSFGASKVSFTWTCTMESFTPSKPSKTRALISVEATLHHEINT